MNAKELLDEWEDGEQTGVRPARLKNIRDDIRRETGIYVPRRPSEIESWLSRMKGQVTKELREAAEAYEARQAEAEEDEESEADEDDEADADSESE